MPLQRTAIGAKGVGPFLQAKGQESEKISLAYRAMDLIAAEGQEPDLSFQGRRDKRFYVFYGLAQWHFERFVGKERSKVLII